MRDLIKIFLLAVIGLWILNPNMALTQVVDAKVKPVLIPHHTTGDTVATSANKTIIKIVGNKRKLTVKRNQNWYDKVEKKWKVRKLKVQSSGKNYDYEIIDDITRGFRSSDFSFKVTSTDNDSAWYRPLGTNLAGLKVDENSISCDDIWEETDIRLIPSNGGFKETTTLKNDNAPLTYKYLVGSNLEWSVEGDNVLFGSEFLSYLSAVDAKNASVEITANRSLDTLIIEVDTTGAVYPIVIDPAIDWRPNATNGIDNYLHDDGGTKTANYGASTSLEAGTRPSTSDIWRPILRFDSVDVVLGKNTQIDSAGLFLVWNSNLDSDSLIVIGAITRDWDEGTKNGTSGTSNWDSASSTVAWTTAGGDFDSLDSQPHGNRALGDTVQINILNTAQYWVSTANYGLILYDRSETLAPDRRYVVNSSDNVDVDKHPYLYIEYTVLPGIGTPVISDSAFNRFQVHWDTTLFGEAQYDSFAVFYVESGDSIQISPFTNNDTIVTTFDTLQPNTFYDSLVIGGYNADTLRYASAYFDVWTTNPVTAISAKGALSDTSAYVDWTAETGLDSFQIGGRDSTILDGNAGKVGTITIDTLNGLTSDSLYRLTIISYYTDTGGTETKATYYSSYYDSVRTLATRPTGLVVKGVGSDTLRFLLLANTDATAKNIIIDSTESVHSQTFYIDSDGDTLNFFSKLIGWAIGDKPTGTGMAIDTSQIDTFYIGSMNYDSVLWMNATAVVGTSASRVDSIYTDFLSTTSFTIYVGDTSNVRISYIINDFATPIDTLARTAVSEYLGTLTLTGLAVNSAHWFSIARRDSASNTQLYFEPDSTITLKASTDSASYKQSTMTQDSLGYINIDSLTSIDPHDMHWISIVADDSFWESNDTAIVWGTQYLTATNTTGIKIDTLVGDSTSKTLEDSIYFVDIDSINITRVTTRFDSVVFNVVRKFTMWTDPAAPTLTLTTFAVDTARKFTVALNGNPTTTRFAIYDSVRSANDSTNIWVGKSAFQLYPWFGTSTQPLFADTLKWFSKTENRVFKIRAFYGITKPDSIKTFTVK